tara:strand:- start:321 stop:509 length:189 start_codon:yes stop_codon:yes gene_type:complete
MKTTKITPEIKGKNAIGQPKEKALKEVFLEEATRVRVELSIMKKSIQDLEFVVKKVRKRLGI